MKKSILCFFFGAAFYALSGESINLKVISSDSQYKSPVMVKAEWNEKWFEPGKNYSYNHDLARIASVLAQCAYDDCSNNKDNSLAGIYSSLGVAAERMEFNYDIDYSLPVVGNNQCAFSFASKKLKSLPSSPELVFVTVRGTPANANEWISNLNVNDTEKDEGAVHEGFFHAAGQVHSALIYYLLRNRIDPENCIFLITGHSRGAAIANLLGAKLLDEGWFNSQRIFDYTFAAPNVSSEEKTFDQKYNFIFNIVNAEDVVPQVPPRRDMWKYRKFGVTKVLSSYWSCDDKTYEDVVYAKVNELFYKFMMRDYCPFRLGAFIPSIVTRILTSMYSEVGSYYGSRLGLRSKAEMLFWKAFPSIQSNDDFDDVKRAAEPADSAAEEKEADKEKDTFIDKLTKKLNEQTNGFLTYSGLAFGDMHICTTYMCFLLALDESQAFAGEDCGMVQLVLDGAFDCAVFDEDGNVLARVVDGLLELKSVKSPVGAMQLIGHVIVGFPSNRNFKVAVFRDALIPSPVSVSVERYSADGYFEKASAKEYVFPFNSRVCVLDGGQKLYEKCKIENNNIYFDEADKIIEEGGIKHRADFRIQPELSFSSTHGFTGGLHIGNRLFYVSSLVAYPFAAEEKSIDIYGGIGHEQILINRFLLNVELYGRNVIGLGELKEGQKRYELLPSARICLSLKPVRRLLAFVALGIDFPELESEINPEFYFHWGFKF
ncbi:lipase family protein [Treponema sp.]|uniref:lipase family protein n=1 Tax=Treponema sp. TaxID=166 RepID=UPI0025F523F7|nr:lipase family protein [Treponema sp.]MCR5217865.1 lipase family protein [Treponema sp.]